MNKDEKKVEEKDEAVVAEETEENVETEKTEETKETSEDVIASLNEEIKKKDEEIAKLKNAYAMAYADTENTRKRLMNEYEQKQKYHIQSFAEVLPVLDNCERALAQATQDEAYRKGVEMIYNQLKTCLEKEGVTEIEALGQPFDGNWHQALMTEAKEGVEPGMVTEVLQKGYKLKDRILRAAMVKVSE